MAALSCQKLAIKSFVVPIRSLSYSEIPKAFRLPIVGSLPYFLRHGGPIKLHSYIDRLHQRLGPIFQENMAGKELLFVSDHAANLAAYRAEGKYPEHFVPEAWEIFLKESGRKRGIFFMNGEEWLKNRKIMNRCMIRTDKSFSEILSPVAEDFVSSWKNKNPGKELEFLLYNWNIECLGVILFGKRLGFMDKFLGNETSGSDLKENFVKSIYDVFHTSSPLNAFPPVLAQKLNLKMWKNFYKASLDSLDLGRKQVEASVQDHMAHKGQKQDTLVQKLLDESMDQDTMANIIIDLFLAAGDTTSQAAMWALYLLGTHPETAERARQEAKDVIGQEKTITSAHLSKLHFLRGVIKEVLRLYPVAPFLTRKTMQDTNLAGYDVPKGTFVITSLYTMGRNEKYFSNSDKFLPERWVTQEQRSEDVSQTKVPIVPFGLGSRSCIGKRISEDELRVLLAKLLLNFDWRIEEKVDLVIRMVSVPSKPLKIKIKSLN